MPRRIPSALCVRCRLKRRAGAGQPYPFDRRPRVLVVAEAFPVTLGLRGDELHPGSAT